MQPKQPWTDGETRTAQQLRDSGLKLTEIAERLCRTEKSVRTKFIRMGWSVERRAKQVEYARKYQADRPKAPSRANWTDEETEMLCSLHAQGFPFKVIAERIGRTFKSTRNRFQRVAARRRSVAKPSDQRVQMPDTAYSARSIPDGVQDRRRAYLNAPHRSITSAFFGDPPKGFSALDQRENA